MIRKRDMVNSHGLMEDNIKDSGRMANRRAKVPILKMEKSRSTPGIEARLLMNYDKITY